MIYLTSVKSKKTENKIKRTGWQDFGFLERFNKKGIGSQNLKSPNTLSFYPFFTEHENQIKQANIELRPKGILIHFKKNNDVYTWPVPYYKLTLYRTEHISIYADSLSISFEKKFMDFNYSKFIAKLLSEKNDYINQHYSLE